MSQFVARKPSSFQRFAFKAELLPTLISGAMWGISEVMFAISLGSLVFSGPLSAYLPYGLGIALFTAGVILLFTALFSRVSGVMASVQDTSAVVMAVMAAGIMSTLSGAQAETRLVSVLAAIALATLLTGVFFVALGVFKAGGFVRYIPYPVIGGFLAGTGWGLLSGSFGVMTQYPLAWSNLARLFQPDQLVLWAPGVLFAVTMFFILRRTNHVLAFSLVLFGAVVVFYAGLWVCGLSLETAVQKGLLLGQPSIAVTWRPLALHSLLLADWPAILRQGGNMGIILVLSLVALLLNASALELSNQKDIDLDRELIAAGLANILSGLGGGLVGFHTLSGTALSYRLGGRGKLPGVVAGIICLAILAAGTALLAFFPKPILGGLLFFLGLDFLAEWLVAGWKKLSHADYAIVWLILLVIAVTNFFVGVAFGLVATILLFVWNYSRINVVHHALSGSEMHSNMERCAYHRQALDELGEHIYIVELQGFLFFGTSMALLKRVRERMLDRRQTKTSYVIFDFRRVSGIDSSASLSFKRIKQLADAHGASLVLTHVTERLQRQLALDGIAQGQGVLVFPDLDHGLEYCEEQLLDRDMVTGLHTPVTLMAQLSDCGLEKSDAAGLRKFLQKMTFQKGDTLIHQGEEADNLYFIELGMVSVYLEMEHGGRVRLQTFGLGTVVGEIGLYLGGKTTASVVADSPVLAYRLSRAALAEMKEKEPQLAAEFHEFIAHLLSERVAATTRSLKAVID